MIGSIPQLSHVFVPQLDQGAPGKARNTVRYEERITRAVLCAKGSKVLRRTRKVVNRPIRWIAITHELQPKQRTLEVVG